jgi:hypothetical protein
LNSVPCALLLCHALNILYLRWKIQNPWTWRTNFTCLLTNKIELG